MPNEAEVKDAAAPRISPWNSLEASKLFVSVLTPLIIALIGFWVQHTLSREAVIEKVNDHIVERRLVLYDQVKTKINDIYCFIEDRGTWKENTPNTITQKRRDINAVMQPDRAIWSEKTFAAYLKYMDSVAFAPYAGGVGGDAKIRVRTDSEKRSLPTWRPDWEGRFAPYNSEHQTAYDELQTSFACDLRLTRTNSENSC